MVLSEHEQQALERIAIDLCADDPRLAGKLTNGVWSHTSRRRRRIGAAVLSCGADVAESHLLGIRAGNVAT